MLAVLAAAAVGLVLEDALQLRSAGARPAPTWDWHRWGFLGLVLAALSGAVYLRFSLRNGFGTLYYIRFLPGWMNDWHGHSEEFAAREHLDERVLSRHIMAVARSGVLDVAEEVATLGRDLQMTMNDDDSGSGYVLAPNMIWPSALALGYGLHPAPGTVLAEMGAHPLSWALTPQPFEAERALRDFTGPEARTTTRLAEGPVAAVLLTAALTAAHPPDHPTSLREDAHISVAVFNDSEGSTGVDTRRVVMRASGSRQHGTSAVVHPHIAASVTAQAILTALAIYPHATVYAILRVPKTVALAIGHHLSGPGHPGRDADTDRASSPQAHQVWPRLILLAPDQDQPKGAPGAYTAMRVHPQQPCAADIEARARRHGLTLTGGPTWPADGGPP